MPRLPGTRFGLEWPRFWQFLRGVAVLKNPRRGIVVAKSQHGRSTAPRRCPDGRRGALSTQRDSRWGLGTAAA
jgi:hypothetical protein